jgi:arginase family enzyme
LPMMKHHTVSLLGIAWDDHSSYLQGTSLAPPEIRTAFACASANKWTESGIDLGQEGIWWNSIPGRTRPGAPPWWPPNS